MLFDGLMKIFTTALNPWQVLEPQQNVTSVYLSKREEANQKQKGLKGGVASDEGSESSPIEIDSDSDSDSSRVSISSTATTVSGSQFRATTRFNVNQKVTLITNKSIQAAKNPATKKGRRFMVPRRIPRSSYGHPVPYVPSPLSKSASSTDSAHASDTRRSKSKGLNATGSLKAPVALTSQASPEARGTSSTRSSQATTSIAATTLVQQEAVRGHRAVRDAQRAFEVRSLPMGQVRPDVQDFGRARVAHELRWGSPTLKGPGAPAPESVDPRGGEQLDGRVAEVSDHMAFGTHQTSICSVPNANTSAQRGPRTTLGWLHPDEYRKETNGRSRIEFFAPTARKNKRSRDDLDIEDDDSLSDAPSDSSSASPSPAKKLKPAGSLDHQHAQLFPVPTRLSLSRRTRKLWRQPFNRQYTQIIDVNAPNPMIYIPEANEDPFPRRSAKDKDPMPFPGFVPLWSPPPSPTIGRKRVVEDTDFDADSESSSTSSSSKKARRTKDIPLGRASEKKSKTRRSASVSSQPSTSSSSGASPSPSSPRTPGNSRRAEIEVVEEEEPQPPHVPTPIGRGIVPPPGKALRRHETTLWNGEIISRGYGVDL
ncbi:hypothetical protein SCHPADRAFT_942899 [Schizopora paradoxa]|uniref:Uncharacterized protein n=1 Tax=Schizopora paradoxa TaxID=27342 RepID=A0A0H2REX6_9AGAM|nr:hypothetical protein SCHPADRAFT_942899 [Schizopora paradoxa]